jgi:hypothetical protein
VSTICRVGGTHCKIKRVVFGANFKAIRLATFGGSQRCLLSTGCVPFQFVKGKMAEPEPTWQLAPTRDLNHTAT